MADKDHLARIKQAQSRTLPAWNYWRKQHPDLQLDLSGADLSGMCLYYFWGDPHSMASTSEGIDLSGADLRGANLRNTNLTSADFRGADLSGADLTGAVLNAANLRKAKLCRVDLGGRDLAGEDLSETDLSGANLSRANLKRANLRGANLEGADLSGANLWRAKLDGINLSKAKLRGANLTGQDLSGKNLSGTDLAEQDLSGQDLSRADLRESNLSRANLSGTNLSGANLSGANLTKTAIVETNLEGASLRNCLIYGISAWDVRLEQAIQSDLVITLPGEPTVTVDNLKVAQFIHLLLNNKEIREVIDTITSKVVLILGRFTPERKTILDGLREALRNHNYSPVLFDFEKPDSRDFTETVRTLAHLARFIIADLTEPSSIPQELQAIVPDLAVPVQPLLQYGRQEYAMYIDFRKYPWVLPIHFYHDAASLLASLQEQVITPAEQAAQSYAKHT